MAEFDGHELHPYVRKVAPPQCPSCGAEKGDWIFGDDPVVVPTVKGEGRAWEGAGMPAIPLVCVKCGFIRLYAAHVLQAMAEADKKKGGNGAS